MVGNQKYVIELQNDGFPCLPIFDLDHIAPNDARLMLKTYLEFTWSESRIALTGVLLTMQCRFFHAAICCSG
jgi:hypothetical protein